MRRFRVVLALLLLSVFALANLSVSGNVCAQSCVPPPTGLVAWWPGDGDANDLAGENDGTLEGGATFAPGMVGQAFSLDGVDDYVSVPDDPSLNLGAGLTVEAWINPSYPHVGYFDPIVKKAGEPEDPDPQVHGYALEFYFDEVVFWVYLDSPGWWWASTRAAVPFDVWTHVAGTFDGEYVRLYVNGQEVLPSAYHPGTIIPSSNPLYIGHDPANSDRWYSGLIDEVVVSDSALSAAEIQAIYLAGSAGRCKAISVGIDIKPGSYPNSFNINGHGVIPVAVLGSDTFDVSQIDLTTLNFQGLEVRVKGGKNQMLQCSIEDVSGDFAYPEGAPDGYDDLVCQFEDDASLWIEGEAEATLAGSLLDGTPFAGTDTINIVP